MGGVRDEPLTSIPPLCLLTLVARPADQLLVTAPPETRPHNLCPSHIIHLHNRTFSMTDSRKTGRNKTASNPCGLGCWNFMCSSSCLLSSSGYPRVNDAWRLWENKAVLPHLNPAHGRTRASQSQAAGRPAEAVLPEFLPQDKEALLRQGTNRRLIGGVFQTNLVEMIKSCFRTIALGKTGCAVYRVTHIHGAQGVPPVKEGHCRADGPVIMTTIYSHTFIMSDLKRLKVFHKQISKEIMNPWMSRIRSDTVQCSPGLCG